MSLTSLEIFDALLQFARPETKRNVKENACPVASIAAITNRSRDASKTAKTRDKGDYGRGSILISLPINLILLLLDQLFSTFSKAQGVIYLKVYLIHKGKCKTSSICPSTTWEPASPSNSVFFAFIYKE